MTYLVHLASFYDREEALVAKTALDSAGLFVVLAGLDTPVGMPELRGAAPLTLYGLAPERNDAIALLRWRDPEVALPMSLVLFRAPLKDILWVAFTFFIGLMVGVPFMIGWRRAEEPTL